jgi:hypothetical protein
MDLRSIAVAALVLTGCSAASEAPEFTQPTTTLDDVTALTAVPTAPETTMVDTTVPFEPESLAAEYWLTIRLLGCQLPSPDNFERSEWAEFQADNVESFETRRDSALVRQAQLNAYLWPETVIGALPGAADEAGKHAINFDRLAAGTVGSLDKLDWGEPAWAFTMADRLDVPQPDC